jgi:hypothetical protein
MFPTAPWLHLWPFGPPASPHRLINMDTAFMVRRVDMTITARYSDSEVQLGVAANLPQAHLWMNSLAQAVNAHDATSPPGQPRPWLLITTTGLVGDVQLLLNLKHYFSFYRWPDYTFEGNPTGTYGLKAVRHGFTDTLSIGLTEALCNDKLDMLKWVTGATPKPF